jgi:hypothetical protein
VNTCEYGSFATVEIRFCDHCSEGLAAVDLGYLWYCQECFDEAANDYAEWFQKMRDEDAAKKSKTVNSCS